MLAVIAATLIRGDADPQRLRSHADPQRR